VSETTQDEFKRLFDIIVKLRGENGCPWDKKQTHVSLREYLLEESYEALEALDQADNQKLCQELGDVLLQIMLHSQIATEKGEFTLAGTTPSTYLRGCPGQGCRGGNSQLGGNQTKRTASSGVDFR
jgi:uncharacterized protein YabN with tetrapyrrole methylase and pyrophosphatase domain